MSDPSTNTPPKEQQPPTPTVQIPGPPPVSLVQPPQGQSPKPSPNSPSPAASSTPLLLERLVQSPHEKSPKCPKPVGSVPTTRTTSTTRNSSYRGIRSRSGKWVSEIREPRKTTRIWLGTYPTPEMAATAYDVAAIALKGPDTDLNFPDRIDWYPKVGSTSATDIRAAAAAAAASLLPNPNTESSKDLKQEQGKPENENTTSSSSTTRMESGSGGQEYIDEEEILNFPNLMADMAEGMLVSPPRMNSPPSDDSPDNSDAENLWTYT